MTEADLKKKMGEFKIRFEAAADQEARDAACEELKTVLTEAIDNGFNVLDYCVELMEYAGADMSELYSPNSQLKYLEKSIGELPVHLPIDIQERISEASKNSGPRDMVLVVPPGPTRIGRMPDIGRGLNKSIFFVPLEHGETVISEGMKDLYKKIGPPIAIDCQMNPDGSLSFGVVPPDADHPPLMEVGGYSDKFKGPDVNPNRPEVLPYVGECLTGRLKPTNVPMTRGEGDPLNLHRKYQVGKLRPEHKLDPILQEVLEKEPGKKKEKNNG